MRDDAIAIVGAACRLPGADDLDAFWRLLVAGGDAIGAVDSARWATRFYHHPNQAEPGKSYTWAAGLISGSDLFEPGFFGISPREAAQMDPQQRLLLELVWHALEDGGIAAARVAGSATGVYIGASSRDYTDLRLADATGGDSYFMTGNTLSILSNRISYIYDLRGPSLTIDTACSSALVALHHACEALRAGRIAGAIVGGINLLLAPYPFIGFSRASMLSRRGRCYAFDARADGYVRGEGGGVVVLKPLAAALADGDPIRAVIMASGVNSDGRTIGLSLPSEAAQAALLRSVYEGAGIAADDLAFFEMHGTGTPAGDPIEAAAVGGALGRQRAARLPIGSVKTNIGHLEPASGIAGLLKAALALEHRLVPPTLNCATPNPHIPFDRLNLRLITAAEPLAEGACYAGVNSFGFGGTNAHVVLAPPPSPAPADDSNGASLPPLLISARSAGALGDLAQRWGAVLNTAPPARVPALLRAAARRRDHHPHRLVAHGDSGAALARALADFITDPTAADAVAGVAARDGTLAFVYAGNGAQWTGMGGHAYRANPAFRDAVAAVDAHLRPALGWSAGARLADGIAAGELARADVAQPLLFAVQVAIVEVLRGLGIVAAGHVGHSVGEIAAAWAAGALSLAEAAGVVVARSRGQQRTAGTGRMAALALGVDAAADLLDELGEPLEIGADNAAQAVTISGPGPAIARLVGEAQRRGVACRELDLDFAFHSAAMDPIRAALLADLAGLAGRTPDTMLVSTVTGAAIDGAALGADYWWRNIRRPVRFTAALGQMLDRGYRIFVEIGPHPVLQSYLREGLHGGLGDAAGDGRVLATLSRRQAAGDPFARIAAACHVAGGDLAAAPAFDGPADPRGLPLYPWQRERFWFVPTVETVDLPRRQFNHPLLGAWEPGARTSWRGHLDAAVLPWLADHALEGVPLLPAAAILDMALVAAHTQRPDASHLEIVDVELRRPLPFEPGRMREILATLAGEDGEWELASRPRLAPELPIVHAVARTVTAGDGGRILDALPQAPVPTRTVEAAELYAIAARLGLDYGPSFRTVRRIDVFGKTEAAVELDPVMIAAADGHLIHPALLDGAFQGLLALIAGGAALPPGVSYLPWRFGRVRLAAPYGRLPLRAELRLTRTGTRSASADIALFDGAGAVVGEIAECWFRRVALTRHGAADAHVLRSDLVPLPLVTEAVPEGLDGFAAALARHAAPPQGAGDGQALLIDALIAAAVWPALRDAIGEGGPFAIDTLVERGVIAADAADLVAALLPVLERFGAALRDAGRWRLAAPTDLPEFAEIWRIMLADAPDMVAELALVAAAAEALPAVLTGGLPRDNAPAAPGTMASGTMASGTMASGTMASGTMASGTMASGTMASAAMVEHLREAAPASAAAIDRLGDALAEIAAHWPAGRPLRILSLGAGAAGQRRLLGRLVPLVPALRFVATDGDADSAARLGFAVAGFVGAEARHWSPGDDDPPDMADFDVVLAVNPALRQPLDAAALARLRAVLAPGGVLAIVEPEPNALWDLVFGQDPRWWRRGGEAALRGSAAWRRDLAEAGFAAIDTQPVAGGPYMLAWGVAPRVARRAAPRREPATIALIAADDILAGRLERDGHRLGDDGDVIVFAAPAEGDDPAEAAAAAIAALARTAAGAAARHAALWLVTTGAQQPEAGAGAVIGAALWGFARVLVNEMPRLDLRLLDLPPGVDAAERAARIAGEIAAAGDEREIVWTEAGRHVPRLRRSLPPRWARATDSLGVAGDAGGLDGLGWAERIAAAPGTDEVAIEVHAAGINFRDVMWAMGLLPEEALIDGFAGPGFGLECAGIVSAVGPEVAGLAVGDRVAGFAPAALGSHVVTAAHAVMKLPDTVGFAEAATIPVAFVTAIYALGTLGRIAAGDRVLIHAAAGGVGLAAIQYARHRGAEIIATAGSPAKRAFLKLAGADHVLDSRDPGFADAVRALTAGAGVDLVLNSLSGEAMEQSLGLLKPFGRFLELGKRDFYMNRRLHLRPMRQNISYFGIDVDQLPARRPAVARALLDEIAAALADGAIRPLAHRVFGFGEIADAFRLMQASGHIGKLVLVPRGNAGVRLPAPAELPLRRDGSYLVTGGLGGFGFAAARWLAENGAGTIALLGRRGAETPGATERVAELAALGTAARVYRGDVADPAALETVLAAIRAELPPLRGVVHAAATIGDGLAADIDAAAAAAILRGKLGGAVALDHQTRADPIELFVLFSSATTLLGAPGQGAYVAANAAVEALARRRRAEGLPALAVGWGPIADTGYLAERPEARDALARRLGARPMAAAAALAALPALAASGLAAPALAETSWNEARRYLPILATPLFADLRDDSTAAGAADDTLAERLASLPPVEVLALLKNVVTEEAATILRLPAGSIDAQRPLSEIGMDSLMAVELRLALESRLRIDLPLVSLAEGTSVAAIAARLSGSVAAQPAEGAVLGLVARYEALDGGAVARPDRPAPENPAPESPAPESPAPESPALENPALGNPAPENAESAAAE